MRKKLCLIAVLAASGLDLARVAGQEPSVSVPVNTGTPGAVVAPERSPLDGSVGTRRDARTLSMSIPAPRGLITDRNGEPLVQNRVGYYLAFEYPQFKESGDAVVLDWARKRIAAIEELSDKQWDISDRRLLAHYKDRRWLPFIFPSPLDDELVKNGTSGLMSGLIFHAVYLRHYPEKDLAAHVLGFVRSKGKLPTGPINFGDPLFEETWGQDGLEKLFDDELTGKPGMRKMIFDSDGSRLLDELAERPRVGNTVVTTLNLDWQRRAEKVLAESCKRGAFVVLDIQTGEVLVLASRPSYDLNVWVPTIRQKEFDELMNDPSKPLYGRAFQAAYPPASTFKPIVAVTALTNGVITPQTLINCPVMIKIGNTWMRNHSKYADGEISVRRALARSNNVWFYQVGIRTRAKAFLTVAERLGFGTKTGLPLINENPGIVPTDDLMLAREGRKILDGDTANFAIGQGVLQSSPLQVAQAMAGLANGKVLPKLRLIRQIQDENGGVISAPGPETRTVLNLDEEAVTVVREGMRDVVNEGYGTGQRGGLTYTTVAGKTGTAQWITNQWLAWYAGFFPYDNPRFAFAVLYEGSPGEQVSGGRLAAPMVGKLFEPLKDEIKMIIKPPARAMIIVEEGDSPAGAASEDGEWVIPPPLEGGILRAVPVAPLLTDEDFDFDEAPPAAVIVPEPESEPEPDSEEAPPAAVIVEDPQAVPAPEPVGEEEPVGPER